MYGWGSYYQFILAGCGGGCEVLARVRMIEGARRIGTEAVNLDKDHILKDKKCGSSTYR